MLAGLYCYVIDVIFEVKEKEDSMEFYCKACNRTYAVSGLEYKCECGGLFALAKEKGEKVDIKISLGEVQTPVIKRNIKGLELHLKLDYMMPTGSFKDRGALILVNKLKELGIREVVEDSSGNAGAAIAAYCAAADIKCSIYLPASTSQGKIKQIEAYGADIVRVPGSREDVSQAVLEAAKRKYYASHVYNPLFFEGTKSIADEIYSQAGMPDYVVVPVGNGTMLLGAYLGFMEIGKLPRILAVQSENCSPIYNQYKGIRHFEAKPTLAEGIAVGKPARKNEIIEAVKLSKGGFVTVSETEIEESRKLLGHMGIYVEMTASAALAGALKYFKRDGSGNPKIIVPLTGTGLKK